MKKKVFAGLACLWLPMAFAQTDDCPTSITIDEAEREVVAVAPSGKECARFDVRQEGENDFSVHTQSIGADGGVNPQGEDSSMVMQKGEDRTIMRIDDQDKGYGQFGGKWPDDEYTRRIPKPSLPLKFVNFIKPSDKLVVMFDPQAGSGLDFESDATIREMRNYVTQLKARGFTEIVTDKKRRVEIVGHEYFIYEAKDPAGYMTRVWCGSGKGKVDCSLNLYGPKAARAELERRVKDRSR
jgi:hypothetical protein